MKKTSQEIMNEIEGIEDYYNEEISEDNKTETPKEMRIKLKAQRQERLDMNKEFAKKFVKIRRKYNKFFGRTEDDFKSNFGKELNEEISHLKQEIKILEEEK